MYYFLQKYNEGEVYLARTFDNSSDTTIKNSAGYYLGKVYFDTNRFDKAAQILRSTADDKSNPFHPFACPFYPVCVAPAFAEMQRLGWHFINSIVR